MDETVTEIRKRRGAYLPHWTCDAGWYSVTFRLWDSLERRHIVKTAQQLKRPLSEYERQRLDWLYSERVERYLDSGHGACYLKDDRVAVVVRNALFHFDGKRYALAAWCVMPNHVHVVVEPFAGKQFRDSTFVQHAELPNILHSWKSFTSKEANKLLRRSGEFWQAEYYDHLIRSEADFRHAVRYVLENPINAGLTNWKWVGLTELGRQMLRES